MRIFLLTIFSIAILTVQASANVSLPALFSDNMVIQRDMRVPIWGWAEPGENITVSIAGQQVSTETGKQGRWEVRLKPMHAGGPMTMTIAGKNSITLKNVLIGEVLVCSGQSNMGLQVASAMNSAQEIAAANHPNIRLFKVKVASSDTPLQDVEGNWAVCSPETVNTFSAVAYYFGRDLNKALDVPIGLIQSCLGATNAEAWTERKVLESDPDFEPILFRLDHYDLAMEEYRRKSAEWLPSAEKARAEGRLIPVGPRQPLKPTAPGHASALYNGMIAPLIPYAIKGVIWYQGESNVWRAYQYRKLFPAMIRSWRFNWKEGDFPFLFVQLASYRPVQELDEYWAELREAQLLRLSLPKTAVAVAIDIGDAQSIHPKNKQEVGRRLCLAAEAVAYGRKISYSGPVYQSMKIERNRVCLQFKHTDGGLIAKDGGALRGFVIAGADRKFVPAKAVIDGDTIVVQSEDIPHPVAIRYAWDIYPDCNLYNKANLPASPFRTDDWPGVTWGAK